MMHMTETALTLQELTDAISGLAVYDHGDHENGIHDDQLKAHVRHVLRAMPEEEQRLTVARVAYQLYLSDAAVKRGSGLENAVALYEWLVFNKMI